MGYEIYPYTQEVLWKSSKEGHKLSDQVWLSIPSCALPPLTEEGIQTEEGSGYDKSGYKPSLQWLQDYNQAKAQLECEVSEQAQKLPHKYDDCQIKLVKKHEQEWVRMAQKGHTTFQEVCAMVRWIELIKLLLWCISSAVPSQHINHTLVTTAQLGKNAPTSTAVPEPEGLPTLGLYTKKYR